MRSELTTWELRYGYLCGAFVMGDAADGRKVNGHA